MGDILNVKVELHIDSEKIPFEVERFADDTLRRIEEIQKQISSMKKHLYGKEADHLAALNEISSIRAMLSKADLSMQNSLMILNDYVNLFAAAVQASQPEIQANESENI